MLNFIFLVHCVVELLVAFLLIVAPDWFTQNATGVLWGSQPIFDVAAAYARMAAVGAILIAIVTSLAVVSSRTSVRLAALHAMFRISVLAFALAAAFISVQPLLTLLLVFNVLFAIAYKYIELFKPEQI